MYIPNNKLIITEKKLKVNQIINNNDITIDSDQMSAIIVQSNTASNKEALKDKIHEIHNYLRNNGAGYGMNALKLFNILYGLKKIEEHGLLDKVSLKKPDCEFSYLLSLANESKDEELAELIFGPVLDSISKSELKELQTKIDYLNGLLAAPSGSKNYPTASVDISRLQTQYTASNTVFTNISSSNVDETNPSTFYNRYITLGALTEIVNTYIVSKVAGSVSFSKIICDDIICLSNYLPEMVSCIPDDILFLPSKVALISADVPCKSTGTTWPAVAT